MNCIDSSELISTVMMLVAQFKVVSYDNAYN